MQGIIVQGIPMLLEFCWLFTFALFATLDNFSYDVDFSLAKIKMHGDINSLVAYESYCV